MEVLDYIVIGLFATLIVLAGLAFMRSGKDMKSFFAAGGSVPWSISGLSLFMSFFFAGTFVVWGSIAYQYGLVAITIQLTMAIGGFVVGYLIAPAWHRTGALTVAEFIRERLGESLEHMVIKSEPLLPKARGSRRVQTVTAIGNGGAFRFECSKYKVAEWHGR